MGKKTGSGPGREKTGLGSVLEKVGVDRGWDPGKRGEGGGGKVTLLYIMRLTRTREPQLNVSQMALQAAILRQP